MNVTLVLARDVVGLQAMLSRVRDILIGVCIVAAALSAAVLSRVVRRSVEPIDDLSAQIADVGERDLSARVDPVGLPTEIAPVAIRLNDLLARLEAAFQRERRFTGDVAHELRTPLAGLRSTLELALSRDRTPAAYRKAMDDCLQINLQMQRMAENLLHLARADAGQLDVRREAVDISELVRDCLKPLEKQANARRLRVEARLDAIGPIETDPDKLRLVLQNLLDNAVTHANPEGTIRITGHLENTGIVLTVSNTGCSLPLHDTHRVFDRFWRGDASCREAGKAHCGLGLPLCKTMIERLNGSIEANITADRVFAITIRLPHCDAGENREQS